MKASKLIADCAGIIASRGDVDVKVVAYGYSPEMRIAGTCGASDSMLIVLDDTIDEAAIYRDRIADLETEIMELRAQFHRCDTVPVPAAEGWR